jgi:acyl-CoA oxidase
MMGCYAQTELGHGSNIAGLETTASLDEETDEFVIHSPTVTSTKYWPGGLGLWANHAAVFAQCLVGENNFGVQCFLVPIRDMDTHNPLKGIKVGDIGPKQGYNSKDNGWIMFDQVRIPRTNMLNRFSYIDKDGSFELRGNPKAIY